MEAYPEVSDEIRNLQDAVVTLRMNIPTLYKKLLLKECEIEHQLIIETDVCVPKQPVQDLKKIERVPKQMFPSCNGASDVQEVDNLLNILHKLFPKRDTNNARSSTVLQLEDGV
ncbi:uncharacterized protein LOC125775111 isoform X1 [Anopheles funestus]|uniref:uncharacterized protein LOC125775111 isoform X1 n=1 Tax=Anopheles funestus TaxID=62324 RepID=UPI0020C65C07|nr:uncharacterized protein LOC125775111 isoform X1 [Anopheles funestus]